MARGGIEPPTRGSLDRQTFIEYPEFWRDYSAIKVFINKLPKSRRNRVEV
jgi:hypothetical protein